MNRAVSDSFLKRLSDAAHPEWPGWVYWISAKRERAGVKIGFSVDPWKRVKGMRTALPSACVLGVCPGDRGDERALHDLHSCDHVEGEWFALTDNVLRTMHSVAVQFGGRQKFYVARRRTRTQTIRDWLTSEADLRSRMKRDVEDRDRRRAKATARATSSQLELPGASGKASHDA